MVRQEDSRLNKLVHVQIQSEPAVRDLAIQTEFVAPPVRLKLDPLNFLVLFASNRNSLSGIR